MNILGVDPGIERTGWGIVSVTGTACTPVNFGCIVTSQKSTLEERLKTLYQELKKIIKNYQPNEAAIEKLYFNINVKTALTVGQARGVALLTLAEDGVKVTHYAPQEIKIATTGYGKADKKQVQKMIKTLLGLDKIPRPDDVADALAVALTHAYTRKPKS